MKLKYLSFFILISLFSCNKINHKESYPRIKTGKNIFQSGIATWYGPGFDNNLTTSGEQFDMYDYTAAHLKLDFQTILRVKNTKNNRIVIVRVNDRGPVNKKLILDLSKIAACNLDIPRKGSEKIEIEVLGNTKNNPLKGIFEIYRNLGNC